MVKLKGDKVKHEKGGCDSTGSDVPNYVLSHTNVFSRVFCLLV